MIKYSILTPVHLHSKERADLFEKCIESVANLDYDHSKLEFVIVNDGSTYPFNPPAYPYIKVVNQPHLERINAYNAAFKEAKGEYILFLDSDDELEKQTLLVLDKAFKRYKSFRMVNFGSTFIHKDGRENQRGPFRPKKKKVGHEMFGGGNIVNGTFVFHRSIYDELGAFPPMHVEDIDCSEINYGGVRRLSMSSPWDFSAYAQLEFPEIRQYFFVDREHEPNKAIKELGNPFGNDFYLFYKFTRKYQSKPLEEYLLRVHLR